MLIRSVPPDLRRPAATRRGGPLADPPIIWLDVSRLLWRAFRCKLSGIDRVEHAYADCLLRLAPERLAFVAYDYLGRFRVLPLETTSAFVEAVSLGWKTGETQAQRRLARQLLLSVFASRCTSDLAPAQGGRCVYLNVSTHPLDFGASLRRLLRNEEVSLVALLHDIIPITHPEYVPARWVSRHHRILRNIAELSAGVIVNSASTAATLRPFLPSCLPMLPLPLGACVAASRPGDDAMPGPEGYFLCLGTIEPRKNHITLLHVWRDLAARLGPKVPRLVIVGARGWECDHILKLIEATPLLKSCVDWQGWQPDDKVARWIKGAKAVLMPSFVEGFGLPVAEALAQGAPVICSDIAAHREIGRQVPDYIAAVDGLGWERAILDYMSPDSPRRAQQLVRLAGWRAVTWDRHVKQALAFVDDLPPSGRSVERPAASIATQEAA
jgi:glycosyltransferase involved in cell wall biosynthesis